MNEAKYTSAEIVRLGKERYEKELRAHLDTLQNRGKLIALDIETGDYETGETTLDALIAFPTLFDAV